MAPREIRDRTRTRSHSNDGEYVLIISGIPPRCRWQELKDMVRMLTHADHVRQASVYNDDLVGNMGSIIIKHRDDAVKAFELLSRNGYHGLVITVCLNLRNQRGDLTPFMGPKQSPAPPGRPSLPYHGRYLPPISPPVSPRRGRFPNTLPPAPLPSHQHHPYYYPAAIDVPVPVRYTHDQYPTPAPPNSPTFIHRPAHIASATTTRPAATVPDRTPNRSIFLSNLPYLSTPTSIRDALTRYGRIERCDVPLDRRDAHKIRGTATAVFVRSEDAARAIRELNGREWAGAGRGAGVRVRARFDRESPERNAPGRERDGGRERGGDRDREREGVREREREVRRDGPLVVDGSRGKSVVVVRRHRRRRDVRGEGGSEESAGSESESGESSSDEDVNPVTRRTRGLRV